MIEKQNTEVILSNTNQDSFPLEPHYHPIHAAPRVIYDFLASAKLAMALLVVILLCCVSGVTVWRGKDAWQLIFNSLWFNSILVLLVVNVACCFFGRIWGRKVTIISFGMILFHLSFVVMLLAIVFNSLFYFRGNIRVTEGESVKSSDPLSYDILEYGRFFSFSQLKGMTTLIKMHTGYKVSGADKRAAYEVAVGDENNESRGIIYITHKLTHHGVDYFNDREGYSLLLMLTDLKGKELYGAHVPLQSIKLQANGMYAYSTGYKSAGEVVKDVIPFPGPPEKPLFAVKAEYMPSKLKERVGDVKFMVNGLDAKGLPDLSRRIFEGQSAVGKDIPLGEYRISPKEVRFWVGMMVRYEPGKPILLASLWVALAGMIITTGGRIMRSSKSGN